MLLKVLALGLVLDGDKHRISCQARHQHAHLWSGNATIWSPACCQRRAAVLPSCIRASAHLAVVPSKLNSLRHNAQSQTLFSLMPRTLPVTIGHAPGRTNVEMSWPSGAANRQPYRPLHDTIGLQVPR